jgi:hypothetical protein
MGVFCFTVIVILFTVIFAAARTELYIVYTHNTTLRFKAHKTMTSIFENVLI